MPIKKVMVVDDSPTERAYLENLLKKKGFEAFVVPPKNSSDPYYRVQMGDFSDRAAAQEEVRPRRVEDADRQGEDERHGSSSSWSVRRMRRTTPTTVT